MKFIIGILLTIIVIITVVYLYRSVYENFYADGMRHTKNMSYDIRGDVPIPGGNNCLGPWLCSDYYNFDYGNNYVRDNGTMLFL